MDEMSKFEQLVGSKIKKIEKFGQSWFIHLDDEQKTSIQFNTRDGLLCYSQDESTRRIYYP